MIPCESCGRQHRTPEAIEACAALHFRREQRDAKRTAELERRQRNAEKLPPVALMKSMAGIHFSKIVAALNKGYPPPDGRKKWDDYTTMALRASYWGVPGLTLEEKTMLLLERYYVGDFITIRPTELIHEALVAEGCVSIGSLQEQYSELMGSIWDDVE